MSHGKSKQRTTVTKNESVSEKGEDRRMARDQQQQATVGEEPLRKRKSVRFRECPDPGSSGGPAGVVPSIVPHLPGLDPDGLYVISGPFPQYDEGEALGLGAPNRPTNPSPPAKSPRLLQRASSS